MVPPIPQIQGGFQEGETERFNPIWGPIAGGMIGGPISPCGEKRIDSLDCTHIIVLNIAIGGPR
jgi:hypothetical protein